MYSGTELAVGLGGLQPPQTPQTMELPLEPPLFLRRKNEKEWEEEEKKERKKKLSPP